MSRHGHKRLGVVIAGGGVAALETLLALRALAGHRVEITLISPQREFLFRPVTVAEAFDRGEARAYELAQILGDQGGGELISDSLVEVDAHERVAITGSGRRVPFDALVVAAGAVARDALPGAFTFRGRADVPALRDLLGELVAGTARSVALALTSERMWPLPIYELALMTAAHLGEHGAGRVNVYLVTPEEEPLELFGSEAARAISPMLKARGIELRSSSLPAMVKDHMLFLAGGGWIAADRVIMLPLLEGPQLPGLPHDQHGFIPVDAHGRVVGLADVYAAGDITTFPLKQGGLAAQQADAIAEVIAAGAGAAVTPKPFSPVLRGLLLTGGAPLHLRSEPQRLLREASVAIEAQPSHLKGPRRVVGGRAGAVVAAGKDRGTLPGSLLRDRATPAAGRRAARGPGRGVRPTGLGHRVRGRARARPDARRLRRAVGGLQLRTGRARSS